MAQVTSGYLTTDSEKGRFLRFDWYITNQDAESNYTDINWSLSGGGDSGYVSCCNFKITINGSTVYEALGWKNVYLDQVVCSGTARIPHKEDGTKTFQAIVNASIYYSSDRSSGAKNWELPTLKRYLDITELKILSVTETVATVLWSTSHPRDSTYYSLDGGNNWIGSATDGEQLSSNQMKGIFTIKNLNADTSYNLNVKIKRTDSQQWTHSELQFSTYDYPHCTDAPNFTIGDRFTLTFYNPLGRDIRVVGYGDDGSQIFAGATASKSLTGFNIDDENGGANAQYASIPNSASGKYRLVVIYGDHEEWYNEERTYSIRGDEVPTVGALSYVDSNESIVDITDNDQHIVQNESTLQAIFDAATPNYCAGSIVRYVAECNGISKERADHGTLDIGTVNSAISIPLKLTVYDSRGLSASKSITVQMIAYDKPKATVDLHRLNNYEDTTYLTVDGSVSSVDGKNTMEIEYRYRKTVSDEPWSPFQQLSDREKRTLELDKNTAYTFNIVVTDAFGGTFSKDYVLNKGVFPLFIDTEKNSVGVNCFPANENSLEVNGYDVLKNSMIHQGTANTDANNVTSNGIWLVKEGAVTNYPVQSGNGILIVFATTINIYYQIFIRFNGVSWSRMCWYGTWQSWKEITI